MLGQGLLNWVLRSSETPGERDLTGLLTQARVEAQSGTGDGWARQRLDWLYRDLSGEKQALSRVFPATVLVFWTLAILTERDTRNKNLWAMLPLSGALTLGIGVRVWMCNALLRRFWDDHGDGDGEPRG